MASKGKKYSTLAQTHKKWQEKSNSSRGTQKKSYFRTNFNSKFLITFSEENGLADVVEKNSDDTFVFDDDAYKVVLCTRSPFFCTRWVLLRSKKTFFSKIHLMVRERSSII